MAKRKRVRFRNITFKFTAAQKKRVDAYCRKTGTTPIRMYKRAIMLYLTSNGYGDSFKPDPEPAKNQMSIFDLISQE